MPPRPGAASGPLRYVALGDSYSAASGVLPPDPTARRSGLRSTSNYPHLIAAATGAQLTDVTCGAADTGDYFAPQYPGIAAQPDALSPDTELVTMTIGGKDSGFFVNSLLQCGHAGLSTGGRGSPCKDRYGASFEDTIRTTTYPSLVDALQAAARRRRARTSPSSGTRGSCRRRVAASTGCPWRRATSPACWATRPPSMMRSAARPPPPESRTWT